MKSLFRSLRHRNFRLFFAGQGVSLLGTWIQQVASGWLIYRLTGSSVLLGTMGFVGQIPLFFLAPLAGVGADRWDRRRLLLILQFLAMGQAVVLAVLTLWGKINVPSLLVLNFILGIVNAFEIPSRQSFIRDLVADKEDLSNAIALNSSLFNSARLIGPALAGVLIAALGEGVCFVLNACSFAGVAAALLLLRLPDRRKRARPGDLFQDFREGFRYTFGSPTLRTLLLLVGLVSLLGTPFSVLMPVFARDIFHGGPRLLGFLTSSVGLGALAGALYLASRKSTGGFGRLILVSSSLFGAGLAAFALARSPSTAVVLLFVVGAGMMVHFASTNTLLQSLVEDDKRGRVMSFYTMAIAGMAPFGSLAAGQLAARLGAPGAVLAGGLVCLAATLFFGNGLPSLLARNPRLGTARGPVSFEGKEAP